MGIKRYFEKLKAKFWNYKTLKFVVNLLFFLFIGFLMFWQLDMWVKVGCYVATFLALKLCDGMFTEVEKYNIQKEIPKAKVRFTKKLSDGRVIVEADKFKEAILFLYEVEEKMNM